jgi:hypothetical protein
MVDPSTLSSFPSYLVDVNPSIIYQEMIPASHSPAFSNWVKSPVFPFGPSLKNSWEFMDVHPTHRPKNAIRSLLTWLFCKPGSLQVILQVIQICELVAVDSWLSLRLLDLEVLTITKWFHRGSA